MAYQQRAQDLNQRLQQNLSIDQLKDVFNCYQELVNDFLCHHINHHGSNEHLENSREIAMMIEENQKSQALAKLENSLTYFIKIDRVFNVPIMLN